MKSFDISTTVQSAGDVHVVGVPFVPGTEVEVSIRPKRLDAPDFTKAWNQICEELRQSPSAKTITDEDIQREIDDCRAGR